jgi:membrane-bound metal-dependent hydrolase YbcI (DUF457 family)
VAGPRFETRPRFASIPPHPALVFTLADFKTHITGSTIVGVAYGYWGVTSQSMSIESGLIAGGLCSVAGMLPDLDSDSGIPLRETSMFAAAVVPMLMIERFRDLELSHESMALAAMLIYIFIRFFVIEFFKRFTVHRGMWHSIPAAAIAGMLAYLAMPCSNEGVRVYKSLAVVVGFFVHLILDEIWSVDFKRGRFRLKNSFGTALKFFGESPLANIMVYAQLFLLCYAVWGDQGIIHRLRERAKYDTTYIAQPSDAPPPWDKWLPWR